MGIETNFICDRCKTNFGAEPYPPLNEIAIDINEDSCVPTHEQRLICQPCFDDTWTLVEIWLKDTSGQNVAWEVEERPE